MLIINCKSDATNKDAMVGTWQVTNYDAQLKGIPDNVLESARKKTMTTSYTFNADNTFTLKSVDVPGNNGKWAHTPASKVLELNYVANDRPTKVIYTVDEINTRSMKWIQNMNEMGMIFITLEKK